VKSAIGTRRLAEAEINTNNRVLWNGALAEGLHPKLYDLNTWAPGRSPSPVTDKRSSESELLMGALTDSSNPLSILPDADVRQVLFDESNGEPKATGVEVHIRVPIASDAVIPDPNGLRIPAGAAVTIHAKTIILSAGALGSPAILLRSDLKNDQIGRGVVLHPSMPILGRFSRPIDGLDGTQASVYIDDHLADRGWALESMSAPPVYAALMSPGSPEHTLEMVESFQHLAGFGVMLIDTPSPENRLTLDENGEPIITYHLSDQDKLRFREGIAEAIRVMFRGGASEVYLPTIEHVLPGHNPAQIEAVRLTDIHEASSAAHHLQYIPNETILTSAHMQATDKMGSSPQNSVVARDFHVWGTRNLYVVDGSIFPTSIGANPMQSIYTFAKIFTERMNGAQEAGD
jgi:choline dehydrogenase-like flavoprotein